MTKRPENLKEWVIFQFRKLLKVMQKQYFQENPNKIYQGGKKSKKA